MEKRWREILFKKEGKLTTTRTNNTPISAVSQAATQTASRTALSPSMA